MVSDKINRIFLCKSFKCVEIKDPKVNYQVLGKNAAKNAKINVKFGIFRKIKYKQIVLL